MPATVSDPTKFTPHKFKIEPRADHGIGKFVRSKDGSQLGYKLGDETACSSYNNGSLVDSCRNTCEEADRCPIWRRTRA